ncbi:hypothetical protein ABPG72_009002 [Tetrahymena utriculariae]
MNKLSNQKGENQRDKLLLQARLAQQTQRFEEMVKFVNMIAQEDGVQLRREEEILLSSAYKSLVGNKRAELRVLIQIEKNERGNQTPTQNKYLMKYINKIEKEICLRCEEINSLIDRNLMKNVSDLKQKILYFKLKGDYMRYYAEVLKTRLLMYHMREQSYLQDDDSNHSSNRDEEDENEQALSNFEFKEFEEVNEEALFAYSEAEKLSKSELALSNPLRLALYLNMSVYFFEIQDKVKQAIQIANEAFQGAINNIESENEENYRDCTLIMQLLRDNITYWNEIYQQKEYDQEY